MKERKTPNPPQMPFPTKGGDYHWDGKELVDRERQTADAASARAKRSARRAQGASTETAGE